MKKNNDLPGDWNRWTTSNQAYGSGKKPSKLTTEKPKIEEESAPVDPEGSFAKFARGESGWSYADWTLKNQGYLLSDNPVGTSAVLDKGEGRYINSAKPADAERSRKPSTSVKGKGATTPFFAAGKHAFHNGGK